MYKKYEILLSFEEMLDKLKKVELLSLDVDGTLTCGGMFVSSCGDDIKRFFAHDGVGISMIRKLGIKVALVTTSVSDVIVKRSKDLNIDEVVLGSNTKGEDILKICKKLNVNSENVIHMGDDVNDILAFIEVGLPIATANAVKGVDGFYCYKTKLAGGFGAVREICDMIMLARVGKLYGEPYVSDIVQ